MRFRVLAAAAMGALTIFQIVRNTVVRAEEPVQIGSSMWPHHPNVLRAVAMREVGEAAAAGQVPSEATMDSFRILATKVPRAPEPFLVQAALAVKEGDSSRAERLLLQGLRRDPRSSAGRFLLAELYLTGGQPAAGLVQLALLTRIMPSTSVPLTGALEQFARAGGTAAQLRQVFAINPALESGVLTALASDPANAALILAAASPGAAEADEPSPAWQEKLLDTMIARRQYREAYQLWLRLIGTPAGVAGPVFNRSYRTTSAPPPFNWSLTSGATGVAERDNGRLHVIHYGTANTMLAKQLLLLSPGAYRLAMSINGSAPVDNQLIWTMTCLPSGEQILAAAVGHRARRLRASFAVPQRSCEAQQLELIGHAQEPVEVADLHFGPLSVERAPR